MTFVLDASVSLAWCLEDERSPATELVLQRLAGTTAIVPAIWPFEFANGLRTAERRGQIAMIDVVRSSLILKSLPIEVEPADRASVLDEHAAIARRLELSVYDAACISLAMARRLPLASSDERLRRAAVEAGVELVE